MRKMYDMPEEIPAYKHAKFYTCKHPLYSAGTLYSLPDGRGIVVVQRKFNDRLKVWYWSHVEPAIAEDIWQNSALDKYLRLYGELPEDGLYPTIPVRRLMWALGMPPIPKEYWEKEFDDFRLVRKDDPRVQWAQ